MANRTFDDFDLDDEILDLDDIDFDTSPNFMVGSNKLDQPPQSSSGAAFANMFIAFVGAGMLNLPHAFSLVGYVLGSVVMCGLSVVNLYCMLLVSVMRDVLIDNGKVIRSYGDIGYHAIGSLGSLTVDSMIAVSQTGFCIAYLIFIRHNLYLVLDCLGLSPTMQQLAFALGVSALVGLSLIRHMKYLAPSSVFADLCYAFGFAALMVVDVANINRHNGADPTALGASDATAWRTAGLPVFFGVVIYCFEGVSMVVPIYASYNRRVAFKVLWSLNSALVTILFALFGVAGYVAFGSATRDIITLNLPSDAPVTIAVRLAFCLGLFCTYPIMMFPVFNVIEGPLFGYIASRGAGGPTSRLETKRTLFRIVVVLTTLAVALTIPNFGLFVSLIGSTACCSLAFVLPCYFHLRLCRPRLVVRIIDTLIIMLGIVGAVVGLQAAVSNIIREFNDGHAAAAVATCGASNVTGGSALFTRTPVV